jgi:hypothetical protein
LAYGLRSERVVRRAHTYRLIHLLGLAIPFSRSFLHLARPTGFYPSRPISMTTCHLKRNETTFCASYEHHPPRTRVLAARSKILYPSPGFPRPAYQPSRGRAEVVRIRSGQRRRAASAAARTDRIGLFFLDLNVVMCVKCDHSKCKMVSTAAVDDGHFARSEIYGYVSV